METIDTLKPVRLRHPEKGEEKLLYKIISFNEETKRYLIEPLNLANWDGSILPVELVSEDDIANV